MQKKQKTLRKHKNIQNTCKQKYKTKQQQKTKEPTKKQTST